VSSKRLVLALAVAAFAATLAAQEPLMRSPNPTPPVSRPITPQFQPTSGPGVTLTPATPRTTPTPKLPAR